MNRHWTAAWALVALVGCGGTADPQPESRSGEALLGLPLGGGSTNNNSGFDLTAGAVFVQGDNPLGGNQIYAFARSASGALTYVGAFATGGNGIGLGDPNSGDHSVLRDGELLFVANGGPNSLLDPNGSVSVLQIQQTGLAVLDTKSTGGLNPVTVARRGGVVVSVNNIDDSLQSYTINAANRLTPATHVVLDPSLTHGTVHAHPSDVVFSQAGTQIVATERNYPPSIGLQPTGDSWFIDVASIDPTSAAVSNVVVNDVGALGGAGNLAAEPFALAIGASGNLVVSHGRYELPYASQEATYTINADNTLTRTSLVPSGGWDDCWSVIVNSSTPGVQFHYVSSFFDSSIHLAQLTSTLGPYSVAALDSETGLNVAAGGLDVGVTDDSDPSTPLYLYVLNSTPALPSGTPYIAGYSVNRTTGALTPLGFYGAGVLPPTAVGIAVQ